MGATGNDFQTVYNSYDRAGNLLQLTYPSLQQVNQDYQNGGSLTATRFAGVNIFSGLVYEAHGAVSSALLGNSGLGQSNWIQEFNSANWPARLLAGPGVAAGMDPEDDGEVLFDLDYTGYDNTGNITAVTRYQRPSCGQALTQHGAAYGYDKLNRLTSSSFTRTGGLNGQYTYTMDAWGNLTAQTKTGGSASGVPATRAMPVADADGNGVPDTNRLSSIDGVTLPAGSYDVLGNQTYLPDPLGGAFTAVYLDQGHIAKLMDGANTEWRYYYDADGQRRIKAAGSTGLANSSFTFYAGNDLICQLDRGSQVQGNDAYTPKFLLTDHLGTTRAELTFDASKTPQVLKTYDYMPYGEEIAPAPVLSEQVKFTGKQRDTESGLDYFGARSYLNQLGRFVSVDPLLASSRLVNPQSWNRYSYCLNNPIRHLDPDGRETEEEKKKREDAEKKKKKEKNEEEIKKRSHNPSSAQILPSNPGNLGPGWRPDPRFDPQGKTRPGTQQWIDGAGNRLRFDPADPTKKPRTDGGKPHYHYNDGDEHLHPGDEIPDPVPFQDDSSDDGGSQSKENINTALKIGAGLGAVYITYRIIRMIPSVVIPPLWPSIPANVIVP